MCHVNGKAGPIPAGGWLEPGQQRVWLAYIRVQLRGLVTCGLSAADRRVTELTLTDRGRHALEEPSEVIPRLLLEPSRETVLLIDLTSANGPWFLLPRPPRRPSDDGPDSR